MIMVISSYSLYLLLLFYHIYLVNLIVSFYVSPSLLFLVDVGGFRLFIYIYA